MIAENDYAKYNIWNLGFVYSDNNVIKKSIFSEISNTWKITQNLLLKAITD